MPLRARTWTLSTYQPTTPTPTHNAHTDGLNTVGLGAPVASGRRHRAAAANAGAGCGSVGGDGGGRGHDGRGRGRGRGRALRGHDADAAGLRLVQQAVAEQLAVGAHRGVRAAGVPVAGRRGVREGAGGGQRGKPPQGLHAAARLPRLQAAAGLRRRGGGRLRRPRHEHQRRPPRGTLCWTGWAGLAGLGWLVGRSYLPQPLTD